MDISLKHDLKDLSRTLGRIQRKQVPFATAKALTDTAKDVQKAETAQIPRKLDRPTPFTQKAIGIKSANKRTLTAEVFVKDIQAGYLGLQITGGTARHKGKGTGVPTRNKRLNRFGNIPGRRKGLVKGRKQFIATIKGTRGVWERTGRAGRRGVRLLIAFEKQVKYRKRFPFNKIAEGVINSRFPKNFSKALALALRTAR